MEIHLELVLIQVAPAPLFDRCRHKKAKGRVQWLHKHIQRRTNMATQDKPPATKSPGGGEQVLNELMSRAKKSRRYRPSNIKDVSVDDRKPQQP